MSLGRFATLIDKATSRSFTPYAKPPNMRATPTPPVSSVRSDRLEKLLFPKNTLTFSWNCQCTETHHLGTRAPDAASTPNQHVKTGLNPCAMPLFLKARYCH